MYFIEIETKIFLGGLIAWSKKTHVPKLCKIYKSSETTVSFSDPENLVN